MISMDAASMLSASQMNGSELTRGEKSEGVREKVAGEFEEIFSSLMLKQMRQTMDDGMFGSSDSSDSYGSLFDMFMGQHLAKSGGLGMSGYMKDYLNAIEPEAIPKDASSVLLDGTDASQSNTPTIVAKTGE